MAKPELDATATEELSGSGINERKNVRSVRAGTVINQTMGPVEWFMLITLSVLWGGSFLFVGVAVRELPTLSIVAVRVGLAAVTLWFVIAALRLSWPRDPKVWLAFLGMGALNNAIPFFLIVWGQQTIASGLASIFNATTPLFTVLIAGFLLADERFSIRKIIGVLLGMAGVVIMIGHDALAGVADGVFAQLAILGAAISYGFAGVFGRRFAKMGINPIVTAAGQVTMSSLILFPVAIAVDQPWLLPVPSFETIVSLVALAVASTAFAYILYFRILQRAGATNLALVTFLIPVSAIWFGFFLLGERLGWVEFVGMAFIALGLMAIDGRVWHRVIGGLRKMR